VTGTDLTWSSLREQAAAVASGEVSAVELTAAHTPGSTR